MWIIPYYCPSRKEKERLSGQSVLFHEIIIQGFRFPQIPFLRTVFGLHDSLQKALEKAGIDLDVSLYRMYGEGRSAGFELSEGETGEVLFTMDIDVNRPAVQTRIYEISDIRFRGVSVDQMLADKISAVSGDKIFRRVKDVVDLYYLSQVFPFHSADIKQILKDNGRELGTFHGFLHRKSELEHAYDKFRFAGDVNKPPFDDVYAAVKAYIRDILPRERHRDMER